MQGYSAIGLVFRGYSGVVGIQGQCRGYPGLDLIRVGHGLGHIVQPRAHATYFNDLGPQCYRTLTKLCASLVRAQ